MRHTFWCCLIRCINTKWIQPELKALQSGHGMRGRWTDGRTDGRTDGVKPIYPPTTSLCRGHNCLSIMGLKLTHVSIRGPREHHWREPGHVRTISANERMRSIYNHLLLLAKTILILTYYNREIDPFPTDISGQASSLNILHIAYVIYFLHG